MKNAIQLMLISLGLLMLAGCKASDLTATAGHYQGLLTEKSGAHTAQTQIQSDITSPSYLHLDIKITTNESPARNWDFQVAATPRGQVSVLNRITNETTALRAAQDACYINADASSSASATTRVCYQSNQVTVDLPSSAASTQSFIMTRTATGNMPELETPADFKLSELTHRSLTRSFSSQIEFENVAQARLNSENLHLSLIPHFSLGDVISLSTSTISMLSLVHMIGDVAPFLIPSNWFKAKEAAFQSDAERYGYLLMQADAGNVTSGLGYEIARDSLSLSKIQEERTLVASIRQQIFNLERFGFLPSGSTLSVDAVLNAADKTILALQQTLDSEYTSLSMAVGFFNPHAIRSIIIDNDLSIDHPETFNESQASQTALTRAAELKQMDFLISAAKTQKTERYFDWLDPAGGGAAIGFGMGSYIAIAQSQLQQTIIKRQQLQAQILANVANTNTSINDSIATYVVAQRSIATQDELVKNYLSQLRLGVSVSTSDVIAAFGGQMQANLDAINQRYQYLVAHDNMERVLYQNEYESLGTGPNPAP